MDGAVGNPEQAGCRTSPRDGSTGMSAARSSFQICVLGIVGFCAQKLPLGPYRAMNACMKAAKADRLGSRGARRIGYASFGRDDAHLGSR